MTIAKSRNALTGFLFILPSFSGMLVFVIVPFFYSLYYCFTEGISAVRFVGIDNFAALIGNPAFMLAVKNTLVFIGLGVPLLLLCSLALSLGMMNSSFLWVRWALLAPLMAPIASTAASWRFMLGADGLLSRFLTLFGVGGVNFLGEEWAMYAIVLLFVWKNLGFMVVIFTSAITAISRERLEVFTLESKSGVKLARHVILPLIAPMAFFAVVISIMNSFKMFREIYILYGEMPPKSIYMIQHFMNNNFRKLNYQRLATAAFLLAGVIVVIVWLFLRLQRRASKDHYADSPGGANSPYIRGGAARRAAARSLGTLAALFCLLPFAITVVSSLLPSGAAIAGGATLPPDASLLRHVSFLQYEQVLLRSPQYLLWFWNSIKITSCTLLIAIPLSLTAAYGFSKFRFFGRDALFFLYIVVMLMPFQATLVPQYITLSSLGLLDRSAAVIFPNAFSAFGAFLMTQFMKGIDDEVLGAGRVDGLTDVGLFLRIVLPQSKTAVSATFVLLFIESWSMVEQPLIFLNDPAVFPLSLSLGSMRGGLGAGAVIFLVLPLLIYLFAYDELVEGIGRSGIK